MRNLDHPNIVKLVSFSESKQYYYIILELCPGGELFHQIVRLTYFSEDLSRHVIVQVAKAIEYLHETSGVVHRFVFPSPPRCFPANRITEILSQRIYSFTQPPLYPAKALSLYSRVMRIRRTKGNSSPALAREALARLKLQTLASPR